MTIEMELEKLKEEVNELKQAVKQGDIDHIVEEISDCYLVLDHTKNLLQEKYGFTNAEVSTMKMYKDARTDRRFKQGYYKRK